MHIRLAWDPGWKEVGQHIALRHGVWSWDYGVERYCLGNAYKSRLAFCLRKETFREFVYASLPGKSSATFKKPRDPPQEGRNLIHHLSRQCYARLHHSSSSMKSQSHKPESPPSLVSTHSHAMKPASTLQITRRVA